MSSERIRRLAERIKERNRRESQEQELQLLRARTLSSKAAPFWRDFVIQISAAVDAFKAQMGNSTLWDDLLVSGAPPNKVEITKHKSPYLKASLDLDLPGSCIRGSFKRAPGRPGSDPLPETPIAIDLKVDAEDHVYGVLGGVPRPTVEDLAESVLEMLLEEK